MFQDMNYSCSHAVGLKVDFSYVLELFYSLDFFFFLQLTHIILTIKKKGPCVNAYNMTPLKSSLKSN